MRAKIRIVVIALVLGAGVAYWFLRSQNQEDALLLYGNVDIREVDLAFRQPGRLLQMQVEEGDRVEKGALLAKLDAKPYREALAVAAANVQLAEAELAKLRRGNRDQDIRRAEAAVKQARAIFTRFSADLARQVELVKTGAASQKNLESVRSAYDEARANLAAAEQALSLQREGFRVEEIASGEARLAAAEAAHSQAKTALGDTLLLAPEGGVILSRIREPGSMLANREPVYTLSLQQTVAIRAYVAEPNLHRAAPGTQVEITIDGKETPYVGQIGFVSPRAEFTPKSVETADLRTDLVYRLRIIVQQPDSSLRQGMPVTVRFAPEKRQLSAPSKDS